MEDRILRELGAVRESMTSFRDEAMRSLGKLEATANSTTHQLDQHTQDDEARFVRLESDIHGLSTQHAVDQASAHSAGRRSGIWWGAGTIAALTAALKAFAAFFQTRGH